MNDLVANLVSGVVGAGIASFAAYRFALRQARLDRDRRRHAVASAILFEIDMLEPSLRKMHGSANAWGASFRPRDAALESFVQHVELFEPKTVNAVMLLRGWVQDLKGSMPDGRGVDSKLDTPHHTWSMRTLAGLTVLAGHDARRALLDEGGQVHPVQGDRRYKEPELPKLPPPLEHLWDPPSLEEPEE